MELKKELDSNSQLYKKRHSMAHILAKAVIELYGKEVKLAIGPAIDNGFYYDFDLPQGVVINEQEFEKIENKMKEIIARNEDFVLKEISKADALKLFADQPYKIELINDLEDAKLTLYYTGEDFVDLCRGPHVDNSKFLRSFAFKISRASGAYWRGNEKNKMLQRVYVYGFEKPEELKAYMKQQEEALLRDHRKLGQELDLFFVSDYAPGMPFYMPKGLEIKNQLISFWRKLHLEAGYEEIETPIAMNRKLWEYSGHWSHYKQNMYDFTKDQEEFAVKPMNCPGGMLYYKQHIHSYKEFPLRVGELGKVHRHEASGTLHGLFRVRAFTQDDAHVFMTFDQIGSEIKNILDLVDKVYSTFGLTYHLELSTMPEDHIGEVWEWQASEKALKEALDNIGKDYYINEGDGAFYGPKIDIHIKDAIGRTWQCGTIQLDMQMPKRFELEYVDSDGSKKQPVMLHRVIYGSIDRFLGILIENFAGAFPLWVSPIQISVINVSENSLEYAKGIANQLQQLGFRVQLNGQNEKINKKIREAQVNKINYMVIVGDREMEENTISVRHRKLGDLGNSTISEFAEKLNKEIQSKDINV